MKKGIILVFFLCSVLIQATLAQTVEWRGIILLSSTKNDVEKLLGKPISNSMDLYNTNNERVVIWYSKGNCLENKSGVWNVPKNTVLAILVAPKAELNVTEIKKELNQKFEKQKDHEMPNIFIYYNVANSIKFQTRLLTNGIEDTDFIAYSPGKSGSNLLCQSQKK